jgi:murein DD-endopeptidase MepM/ murein hydrolase activator NlpD
MPVGDPYRMPYNRPQEPGSFSVLRSVEWEGNRPSHQGADLGCGAAGSFVRAAATGVVVRTADNGPYGGYGTHVVLGHRLPDGTLIYTVYAHMRLGSIRVRVGRLVQAGAPIGRIGATGRAEGPHLHFEVRRPEHPEERWELAGVEDPLTWVEERLPSHRADTTGVPAYLEWAEYAALLSPGARGDDVLTREQWWRMIAASLKGPTFDLTLPAEELCDSLVEAAMLPERGADLTAGVPVEWAELARDLGRARQRGARTGPGPLRRARHRALCEATFGFEQPLTRLGALSGREGRPCLADAALLLADLAGPAAEPPRPSKKVATPATPKPLRVAPDSTARRMIATAKPGPRRGTSDTTARRAAAGAAVAGSARSKADTTAKRAAAPIAGAAKPGRAPKRGNKAAPDSTAKRAPSEAPIASPADSL